MIAPDLAGKLLDDVIYERVLHHIDIEALHAFELELWLALRDHGIEETAFSRARELVDRALDRFRTDPRRIEGADPFGDCELCAREAAAASESSRRPAMRAHGSRDRPQRS